MTIDLMGVIVDIYIKSIERYIGSSGVEHRVVGRHERPISLSSSSSDL